MLHLQVFQPKTNDKFCKASSLAWIDTLYMLSMWQVNLVYLAEVKIQFTINAFRFLCLREIGQQVHLADIRRVRNIFLVLV